MNGQMFQIAAIVAAGKRRYKRERQSNMYPKNTKTADVFGAMGSWNDTPPYMAQEKGLEKEYDELSDELLKNIRLAILCAVNEW